MKQNTMKQKIIAILIVVFMLTSTFAFLIGGGDGDRQEDGLQQDNNSAANETALANESYVSEWDLQRVWCPDCGVWK